ncbi:MAG TPA: MFS transporter [Chthoniobacterales bacterium]|jgi:AAA family ATP:ADP antiporter|nr:MFS transporter [Chthoniobacterales bacterium]
MKRLLQKIVDVRANELHALGLAFVFNFVVLGSYYVVRPIRDDIAATGGIETLPWMYTGTLVTMLVANALFSAIVARMSRRRFIPIAYRFFMANLVIFYVLMHTLTPAQNVWVGRAFYVWVSVFNLFVVTLFWAFMTDVFNSEQAKRLFAFISVGGSIGAIVGPIITVTLVHKLGAANLILVTAAMLEAAPWCVKFFPTEFARDPERQPRNPVEATSKLAPPHPSTALRSARDDRTAEQPIGGGILAGITHVIRSPYLLGICGFVLLYTVTTTFSYFQQTEITGHQFQDRNARTAFFAQLDLVVNTLTLVLQLFITGHLMKRLGVGITLVTMPLLSMVGFLALGFAPTLGLLAVFQVARRATNFGFTRPAREVLFTVLRREDKYKAKSLIDTFVYRTGDQIGAWSYSGLRALGLQLTGISFVAVPLTALWCGLCFWLGKKQSELALVQRQETHKSVVRI